MTVFVGHLTLKHINSIVPIPFNMIFLCSILVLSLKTKSLDTIAIVLDMYTTVLYNQCLLRFPTYFLISLFIIPSYILNFNLG